VQKSTLIYFEVVLDGADELVRVLAFERRVDATLAVAVSDFHPQVTWEREDCSLVGLGVDADDHDGVTAFAEVRTVPESSVVGRIRIDAVSVRIGAGDEIVLCR